MSVGLLALVVGITVIAALLTSSLVQEQESRLLHERAAEVAAVLDANIGEVSPSMASIGDVLARQASTASFERVAHSQMAAAQPGVGFSWLKRAQGGWRVLAAVGPGPQAGAVVTGVVAATLTAAATGGELLPTPVTGTGASRSLGFADGSVAPAGTVVYRTALLGPLRPMVEGGPAFADLGVVLYAAARPDPTQIAVETTAAVPLRGRVASLVVPAGAARWLLQVNALDPLVGSVAARAQWAVVAVGMVLAAVAVSATEIEGRRREAAQALYAGEHDLAETLQRSLLPNLVEVPGLDIAARYLAGGAGQQVGGDWFDVFELAGGRTGVVIGDVMGHDLVAAAAMSQVRASLRAFAWQGQTPDRVIEQLDLLVDSFALAQLVTLFYGTLDPAGPDGIRVLRYANAGHLPPLVRHADGRVVALDAASSVVIGAVPGTGRTVAEEPLEPGALLVCFTDGLVETPGGSLEISLGDLAASVATAVAPSAEALCARLVDERGASPRDDVAVLVVGIRPDGSPAGRPSVGLAGTS